MLRVARTPSRPGMMASITMTSGRCCKPSSTASRPSLASAITTIPACSSTPLSKRRANGSSSATMTRSAPAGLNFEACGVGVGVVGAGALMSIAGGREGQPELGAARTVLADFDLLREPADERQPEAETGAVGPWEHPPAFVANGDAELAVVM